MRIEKSQFFRSLDGKSKIKILEGFISLLQEAEKLRLELWNINIRTV
jgi:hypothetical protein